MMKIKKIIIAVAAIFVSVIANAQTSNLSEGCAPLEVIFTAPPSTTTWFWDFKDLSTSDLQNPTHTFAKPGTYVVIFRKTPTGPAFGQPLGLGKIPDMPFRAKVSWFYEEGDEDMCDLGFILRSLVSCPFHIIEVDDINKQRFDKPQYADYPFQKRTTGYPGFLLSS